LANIFDSKREHFLLKDERFLYPEFVPERLPFRDEEIGELVFCLKPASQGQKPTNLFIHGKPGTGKTVTAKFVLNELTEFSDRVKCLYINCFQTNTRHAILIKVTNFLGYPVPERGFASEEVFLRFAAILKTKKIVPILVLDEAEQLLKDEEAKKLLYDLSRLGEQQKLFTGLVFISNDNFFLSNLDDRVRSSLQASTIAFEQYTSAELKEVLNERAKYAFNSNALEADVVALCAAHAAKSGGDARVAIDVLLKAARLAEKENAKQVQVKHVRAAFMQEKPVKIEITSNFSGPEQAVMDFLKEEEVESGELYANLEKKFAERTLRQALSSLEEKKLITTKKVIKGRGFTRIISKVKK